MGGLVLATLRAALSATTPFILHPRVRVFPAPVSVHRPRRRHPRLERDYDYSMRLHQADLEAPEVIGLSAGERAVRRLNARKARTGPATVIYDPRVARGLAGHLAGAINGASVARKDVVPARPAWASPVASSAITVTDDPLLRRGPHLASLRRRGCRGTGDDHGGQGRARRNWFLSHSTARELGLETQWTAASRSASTVSPSSTNLAIEPGEASPEELIASVKSGFYVTEVFGQGRQHGDG